MRCKEQIKEEFDILELDKEDEFCCELSNQKILKRLHNHNINCFFVDMWSDKVAYVIGLEDFSEKRLARVLKMHEECIYIDFERSMAFLNLFQEKVLRAIEEKGYYGNNDK